MLTPDEEAELRRCEAAIGHHESSGAAEKGAALRTIRDGGLYRRYPNFEAYCQDRWEISRRRAYELIEYASTRENLCAMAHKLPNERQARTLSGLTPEGQRDAWQEAVSTSPGGRITAAHVARVAGRYREAPAGDVEELPPWHMVEELMAVRDAVARMAGRWPHDKLPVLAAKLVDLGHELGENGLIG